MIDLIGWVGFVSGISAYVLLSIGKQAHDISSGRGWLQDIRYKANLVLIAQSLNVLCSISFIISSWAYKFWQSTAFNTIWLGISLYFLVQEIRKNV